VRPLPDGEYELVAGERRLRAAREIGLESVPIVVRDLDDRQALQVALMENLQREDLNPVEETDAVLDLLALALEAKRADVVALFYQAHHAKHRGQELGQNVLSQLEIVQTVMTGVGRFNMDSFRSSRLSLLKLPTDVLTVLRQGKLEYTKGQAIARVKDEGQRAKLLKQAVAQNLSLNEIKAATKELGAKAESTPEIVLVERLGEIGKRLRKSETWGDQRKRDKITKLLDELDKLTADSLKPPAKSEG
jgi:ParB family transcriptional regulator, chromosome partitioning protein